MADKESDLSLHSGHRERLRKNFLDGKLANYEILELWLSYAIPRRDVRPLARMLFKKFGGMYQLLSAPIEELCKVRGMGLNTAIFIKTVQAIMLEGYHNRASNDSQIFQTKEQIFNYFKLMLGGKSIEEMHILYLDANHRLIKDELHSVGSKDDAAVYPTEIAKHAVQYNAQIVALIHNHPRDNTSFSRDDVDVTRAIVETLKVVGVQFLDHFVVSGDTLYAMREYIVL